MTIKIIKCECSSLEVDIKKEPNWFDRIGKTCPKCKKDYLPPVRKTNG